MDKKSIKKRGLRKRILRKRGFEIEEFSKISNHDLAKRAEESYLRHKELIHRLAER